MKDSRRRFLKLAGISAFALIGGLGASGAQAQIAPGKYIPRPGGLKAKRWAMVIDTRRFASAEDYAPCIEACDRAHNIPHIPTDQNVKWIWTDTYDHVFPDDMNNHLNTSVRSRPYMLLCNHCDNPPCVRVCPTQATYKMPNGIVAMDYHRCIGCRFCMAGCPYGARSFNFVDPRKYLPDPYPNKEFPTRMIGVVEKCNFCVERLADGKMPACVEASNGKIAFGDLEDPNSSVRQALANNFSIRRKPSLGTQPGVYYLI
ncbi:MAG: 4Fe-4S dicluster domain-containing protein [Desulfovibrio sp.]|nr:4Fe-4S dicluster domain-containing protein [Desulfovibrio sp.]